MERDINLSVFAPVSGTIVPLCEVPDAIFAEKMLGDGLAIVPSSNIITSPVDGTVKTLHKAFHAIVIESKGVEVLTHIGVETLCMKGEGFCVFVKPGQAVKRGDKLISFDRDLIARKAHSNHVVVIISNRPVELAKAAADPVRAGDLLFAAGVCAQDARDSKK